MTPEQGQGLIALARASIAQALGLAHPEQKDSDAWLDTSGATFVTLTKHGQLRGCVGTLQAYRPLREDIQENAKAAAFYDSRFSPLTASEFPHIRVEVSLLTPSEPLTVSSANDLYAKLQPGTDGLTVRHGFHKATFLPQVWEQLPKPEEFVSHLLRKSGLPGDFWSPELEWERYRVKKWQEHQT